MAGHDPSLSIQQDYRAFSQQAARGRSPAYEALAVEVAGDPAVLAFPGAGRTLLPDRQGDAGRHRPAWHLAALAELTGGLTRLSYLADWPGRLTGWP